MAAKEIWYMQNIATKYSLQYPKVHSPLRDDTSDRCKQTRLSTVWLTNQAQHLLFMLFAAIVQQWDKVLAEDVYVSLR